MALGTRGRGGKGGVDVESLERDNDRGLDTLAERVGLLKAATLGIKNEADSQHNLLDNMDGGMMNTRGFLSSVNDKFKLVMSNKQNRTTSMMVVGVLAVLFVIWYLKQRAA
mmetsp:Transcript_19227/g.48931  ORF Transcript_19227/g.48931 Transcript_19227/m.48931 type:complete len:111 (+) Transcript_19227:124-456(+)